MFLIDFRFTYTEGQVLVLKCSVGLSKSNFPVKKFLPGITSILSFGELIRFSGVRRTHDAITNCSVPSHLVPQASGREVFSQNSFGTSGTSEMFTDFQPTTTLEI